MEQQTTAILLCGNRIALPVLRTLVFHKQVVAIVIPGHCNEFAEQVRFLLKDTDIEIQTVTKHNYTVTIQALIKKHDPVIGFMFSFSYRLTAAVYTMTAKGFYNIHPGPLPAYKGPDPVFQQIRKKELYAAITIHKVNDELDGGEIVLTDRIRVSVTDTYGSLTTKLAELAALMLATLVKMAEFGVQIHSRVQDISKAHFYPKQRAKDISIHWESMYARDIIALIQACNPWNKGAATKINHQLIWLLEARLDSLMGNEEVLPGTIVSISAEGIKVKARDHIILLKIVYCEEGFMSAERLVESGIREGHFFESI